jgi:hypothetical protein
LWRGQAAAYNQLETANSGGFVIKRLEHVVQTGQFQHLGYSF